MIDLSKAVDLSNIGKANDQVTDDIKGMVRNTGVEMTPSEENAIYQAVVDERYSQETQRVFHSIENGDDLDRAVRDFARHLVSRIANIGFSAAVSADLFDTDNFDMTGTDGNWSIVWHPKVEILRRNDGKGVSDMDEEQIAYEVRHGESDGKTGHFDKHGRWSDDPDTSKMIV